ncbi:hypothetical protein MMC12_007175 [Toensbergia leucococca]|nr:hypothetical protein [Toensbergia leucococca]
MSEYYTTPFDKFQNSTLLTASYSHSHQLSASLIACIVAAVLALINIAATAVIFVLLKRMRKLSYRYNPPLARTELLGSEVLGNPRQELPDNSRADLSRRQSHNGMGALRPDLSSGAQYGYVEQRATYSTNEVGRERVMPWATKYDALDGKWPVELSSTDAESRQFELDGRPLRSDSERTSIVQSSTPRRDSGLISHMHGSTLHDAKSVPTSTFDANRRLSHTHQSFSPLRAEMQSPELGPDLVSPSSHVGYTPSSMTRTFPLSPVSAISTPTNRVGPGDNVGMNYSSPSGYNGFLSDLDGRPIQQSPDSTPLLYDGPDVQSAPVGSALQSPSIGFAQSPQSGIQSYELSNPVRSIDPHHGNDISGNDPFIVGDKRHISASLSNTVHPSVVRPERLNQAHAKYTEGLSLNSSPSSAESWESLSDPSWSFNRPTNMTTPTSPAAYSGTPYLGFR